MRKPTKIFLMPFILAFLFLLIPNAKTADSSLARSIKILLVPGHDNQSWGSRYGNLKEADMNLALATQIHDLLKGNNKFEVYITRDANGYTEPFKNFESQKDAILAFEQKGKQAMKDEVKSGVFVEKPNPPHHAASEDTALRLYGFNKWADENKMDAVIHVHFNDYPRKTKWTMGIYRGFNIYIPDSQFLNAGESAKLAQNIFAELKKKYMTSTYPPEKSGLTQDQKLIAIGANNTLDPNVRSVLIEYGYIYRFGNSAKRHEAYKNMAELTVAGIKNYFFPEFSTPL
jgi:N-acetylmuramoyl-L-alanine amidase